MNKRFISLLLCVVFLLAAALPVYAEDAAQTEETTAAPRRSVQLQTLEDFLTFAENCRLDSYSRELAVTLEADIDLSGTDFEGIPVFSGSFAGKDHTISGLNITADGSAQGLFRYLTEEATVENLNVRGNVLPGGSRSQAGGIAGSNAGIIRNCSFSGNVSGGSDVGGIAGTNRVTGVIENCRAEGELHGDHFVGGMAGSSYGVIRSCENSARINTTAQQNSVELSDITIDTLTNAESAGTVTDIGGIAGLSSGVIRGCTNHGDVGYQQMGYNIGGIAGTQSGYVDGCENYGSIQGRKEVGGIVGQMEPVTVIAYSEDTLQILRQQLNTMGGLVNHASGNAQANASQVSSQIGTLRDQAQTAQDAVESLIPDENNPTLPDIDTILAAQNTLSTTMEAMPGTMNSIVSASQNTLSTLTRDLQAVSGQLTAMGQTLNGASENLGGSIQDVSDADTPEMLTGKLLNCVNYGSVLADMNAGGIAGAMAMENDLDIAEDWQSSGEDSLNFQGQIRAVLLSCENGGTVTAKKQNAGGIVGLQALGLVKDSRNTGTLDAGSADYVGGISGLSMGFIRSSQAKCRILGGSYVGGIAGSASTVTDCRSMSLITGSGEKLGGVLGQIQNSLIREPGSVSGNYSLRTDAAPGAIDGVSYRDAAQGLELEEFLALEDLPELFGTVSVRFLFHDGSEEVISVASGDSLDASRIPALPEMDGYTGIWQGLDTADLSCIIFDTTFTAEYISHGTTVQSDAVRDNGLPVLLVQGDFLPGAALTLTQSEDAPVLTDGAKLLESWLLNAGEDAHISAGRYLLPTEYAPENTAVYVRGNDGSWQQRGFTVEGSYLAFSLECDDSGFALAVTEPEDLPWGMLGAGAAAVLAVALTLGLLLRKKKPADSKEEKAAEAAE